MTNPLYRNKYFNDFCDSEEALSALNTIVKGCNTTIDKAFPWIQKHLDSSRLQIITILAIEALNQPKNWEPHKKLSCLQEIKIDDILRTIETEKNFFKIRRTLRDQPQFNVKAFSFNKKFCSKIDICNLAIQFRLKSDKYNIESVAKWFKDIRSLKLKEEIAEAITGIPFNIEDHPEDEIFLTLEIIACNALIKVAARPHNYSLNSITNGFFNSLPIELKKRIMNVVVNRVLICINNHYAYTRDDILENLKGGICNELISILMESDELGVGKIMPELEYFTSQPLRIKILSNMNNEIFEFLKNKRGFFKYSILKLKIMKCNVMIKYLSGSDDLNIESFIPGCKSMHFKIKSAIADSIMEGAKHLPQNYLINIRENLKLISMIAVINALIRFHKIPIQKIEYNSVIFNESLRNKIIELLDKGSFQLFISEKAFFKNNVLGELEFVLKLIKLYLINEIRKLEIIYYATKENDESHRFRVIAEVSSAISMIEAEAEQVFRNY